MPRVSSERHTAESPLSLGPFRALRYGPAVALERALAPPYDVVERDEIAALAADPHNIVRVVLPNSPTEAAATLSSWAADGILRRDVVPGVYVYEQATGGDDGSPAKVVQRGLIGALDLSATGAVLPHEDVMPGPVADRADLMRATEANLEPIWLLYRGKDAAVPAIVAEVTTGAPLAEARTPDAVRHRLWAITEPETLRAMAADLASRQALIADGHHRHAAYGRLRAERHAAGAGPGPWDSGLALLVDLDAYPPELGAIHRHVDHLSAPDAAALADRLPGLSGSKVTLGWREVLASLAPGTIALTDRSDEVWLIKVVDPDLVDATVRLGLGGPAPETLPPEAWRRLDTVLLHDVLLPAWHAAEADVTYHHDAEHAVDRTAHDAGTAVLLAPVDVADVFALAEQGVRMPRKSTSFGPKPRSGLVLRTFADDQ